MTFSFDSSTFLQHWCPENIVKQLFHDIFVRQFYVFATLMSGKHCKTMISKMKTREALTFLTVRKMKKREALTFLTVHEKTTISLQSGAIFALGAKTTIPYESGIILKEKWRFRAGVGTFWQETAARAWEHFSATLRRRNDDSVREWEQFDKKVTISLRSGAIFEWETKTTIPYESGNYSQKNDDSVQEWAHFVSKTGPGKKNKKL